MFTRYFPLWVSLCAIIALIEPKIFTWFSGAWITYGLGGIMLGMGLNLEWVDFKQVAKTPLWVTLGLVLQFTVMPLLGWGLSTLFQLPPYFAVGVILVSCCPGGTASNVIAYLANANVALSVAMTTCSTIGAIVLTPFLTASLSGNYLDVDAWGLFYSTVKVVLVPVFFRSCTESLPAKNNAKNRSIRPIGCSNTYRTHRGKYHWAGERHHFKLWNQIDNRLDDLTPYRLYHGLRSK
ncbi:bile acid:sodium symporter family protein [Flavobacteriaceae bacterium]|nr:bile acid:sodium symporter family protein [Flavobacteriaceae bacterium]